jgi:hypothetical protein
VAKVIDEPTAVDDPTAQPATKTKPLIEPQKTKVIALPEKFDKAGP